MENEALIRHALALGVPLHVVEEYLDWLENVTRERESAQRTFWVWLSEANPVTRTA